MMVSFRRGVTLEHFMTLQWVKRRDYGHGHGHVEKLVYLLLVVGGWWLVVDEKISDFGSQK